MFSGTRGRGEERRRPQQPPQERHRDLRPDGGGRRRLYPTLRGDGCRQTGSVTYIAHMTQDTPAIWTNFQSSRTVHSCEDYQSYHIISYPTKGGVGNKHLIVRGAVGNRVPRVRNHDRCGVR